MKSKIGFKGLFLKVVIFTLCANMVTGADICSMKWVYFFQNVIDVLTVQPTDSGQMVVQPTDFLPNSTQYFTIECGSRPGLFYAVHIETGQVLDVERDVSPHRVILAAPDDSLWQQWFLDYGNRRVTNAATQMVLAIEDSNFVPGAAVVVESLKVPHTPNQMWIVDTTT
ncbi:hypothetical protein Zmor_001572 [Zophobas morio]|uniref:Ricin B lectin domain-containing protein n=2 Tax=Zophobas morio TaxID=2755281 RepID=A0AA38J7M0_9CUCU|nr:hypothetical protein Zmor_001572 [Zophobas morio]